MALSVEVKWTHHRGWSLGQPTGPGWAACVKWSGPLEPPVEGEVRTRHYCATLREALDAVCASVETLGLVWVRATAPAWLEQDGEGEADPAVRRLLLDAVAWEHARRWPGETHPYATVRADKYGEGGPEAALRVEGLRRERAELLRLGVGRAGEAGGAS